MSSDSLIETGLRAPNHHPGRRAEKILAMQFRCSRKDRSKATNY